MQNLSTKRVFIALNLPSDIKTRIIGLLNKLSQKCKGVKWVKSDGLHLTLHFLGDLNEEQIEQVKLTMQSMGGKFKQLQFKTTKINAFPNLTIPRVIFLDCQQTNGNSVLKLQKLLGEKLTRLGFTIDQRPWRPHITLGRVKGKPSLNFTLISLPQTSFALATFELMESILKPTGAEYKKIFNCRL